MNANKPAKGRIIVFGILFWYPLAGVTYQFLHYLLGLRRLGYDPYYIEDSGRWIYDPNLNDLSPDASGNISAVLPVLERYGFGDRWAFRAHYPGGRCYGMSEDAILRLYREADAFLNVTGAQEIRDEHMQCKRRIYVESDPFASQVKVAKGDESTIRTLAAHDTLFTFGENIGQPDCSIPVTQSKWLPTRQPVALDLWPVLPPRPGASFNTITTWHNKGKNIEYKGETYYWTKDREFEHFLELPLHRQNTAFELATGVDEPTRTMLEQKGWRLANSVGISSDVDSYSSYIQNSRGEFTVARDQYVRPNTGWFSDRSACYLAAGRPVITQETGFGKFLPTGSGLYGFRTTDDILAAVDSIASNYPANCRGARDVAAQCFDAEKVIGELLAQSRLDG